MKTMKFILTFFAFYSFLSCEKVLPPIDTDPCIEMQCDSSTLMGKLDTLWTAPLPNSTFGISSHDIYYLNGNIIISASTNQNAYITSFGAENGNNNWIWKEINVSHFPSSHLNYTTNTIIVQNRKEMAQINLNDGTTYKLFIQTDGGTSNPYGQLLGDYYYYSPDNNNKSTVNLVRSNINDFNNWETVYTLNRGTETGNSRPNIQSYNLWINPNSGDSILIFQHRMAFPNRVDVIAYNLNSREIIWKHEKLTKNGNSNHQQIFLHDNKAYFGGSLTFYCFDMFTGDILWEHDDPNNTTTFMILKTTYSESENAIIVKVGQGIYAFDPNTGKVKWHNPYAGDSSVGSGSPTYYDGIIYYTADALLYAVRASSGTVLWSERSSGHPFGATTFRGDVAIDPERRVLYATNNNTLFAIKLFKP